MGSIILPNTVSIPNTQENFPSLYHYFPCTELSGTTITDTVGGVVMSVDSIAGDGTSLSTTDAANGALADGEWFVNPVLDILVIAIAGYMYGNAIHLGGGDGRTGTDNAIGKQAGIPRWDIGHNGVTADSAPGGGATTHAATGLFQSQSGNTFTAYANTATGTFTQDGTPGNTTGMGTVDFDDASRFAVSGGFYGLMIFLCVNGVPVDLEAALGWMANEWTQNGSKQVYPGWQGRTL